MPTQLDATALLLLFFLSTVSSLSTLPSSFLLLLLLLSSLFLFPGGPAWFFSNFHNRSRSDHPPIPGPSGFSSPLSSPLAHRVLAEMARALRASQLMAFSIGSTRFAISSSPKTAREILSSSAFADRPMKESAYELLFHRAMGFAPFGDYWRSLRRISAAHMFSPRKLAASGEFRKVIGLEMVGEVKSAMGRVGVVEVKKVLHFGSLNSAMVSVFGRKYDFEAVEGAELEEMVREGYELLGMFNWGDHLPLVGWLDLQGVRRRCRKLVAKVNGFVGRIIEEHRDKRAAAAGAGGSCGSEGGDFVDVLLDLEGENMLSDSDMVAVLWEMVFRGTDTVAILLEWILARMVLHPEVQSKAQAEIAAAVGTSTVSDSDVASLPYLQSVVKETLRMHPPGPLLSWARLATRDARVGGHLVPAGTTAMVNMWAIARDEKLWPEPEVFRPERFEEEDVAVTGSDLRLAPFGSGRRVCPGKSLGLAAVHLWLAQLLQNFRWVPAECGVDLSERLRMSLEMESPLVCRALFRGAE